MPCRCAAQQTSTAKLVAFFSKFLKTVLDLKVNETEVTSANVFLDYFFSLKRDIESKAEENTVF